VRKPDAGAARRQRLNKNPSPAQFAGAEFLLYGWPDFRLLSSSKEIVDAVQALRKIASA
jgi:hypothetical protein